MAAGSKEVAINRLLKAIDDTKLILSLSIDSPDFLRWKRSVEVAIDYTFGSDSRHLTDFNEIRFTPFVASYVDSRSQEASMREAYVKGLDVADAILASMIEEIMEYWPDTSTEDASSSAAQPRQEPVTNEIFLIHGRDMGARDTVARFLGNLGIEAIILQEQPDEGQTIIEKFERYTEINFALALFTPDDVGGLADEAQRPRSRQNVIFEFGYFIGKYGRNRVRALVKGDIEIPSDYSGVLYIQFDESERWKMDLIRELKSAGFDIDANRAFE